MRKFKNTRCPACSRMFKSMDTWCSHINTKHPDIIPEGFSAKQYLYGLQSGKYEGHCMYCNDKTSWNEASGKYSRICFKPACRKRYSEMHGTADPTQQRSMLANRKISSVYNYDGVELVYTGSYERKFLEFMHDVLKWPVSDIIAPSPNSYEYEYINSNDPINEGQKTYIPDFYIPSLQLEVEIKDQTTTHPKFLRIDKVKEACKDAAMQKRTKVRYYKLNNNDFLSFVKYIKTLSNIITDAEILQTINKHSMEALSQALPGNTVAFESMSYFYGYDADELVRERLLTDEIYAVTNDMNIIIIHHCDTIEELDDLYRQWVRMPENAKKDSENLSMHYFGIDNLTHYYKLRETYLRTNIEMYNNPFDNDDATSSSASESYVPISSRAFEARMKNHISTKFENIQKVLTDISKSLVNENGVEINDIATSIPDLLKDLTTYTNVYSIKVTAVDGKASVAQSIVIFKIEECELYFYTDFVLDGNIAKIYAGNTTSVIFNNIGVVIDDYMADNGFTSDKIYEVQDLTNPVIKSYSAIIQHWNLDHVYEVDDIGDIATILSHYSNIPAVEGYNEFESDNYNIALESISLYQPNHSWYQKMFTGMGLGHGNIIIKKIDRASNVRVEDGMIYIERITTHALFHRISKVYNSKNVKNIFLIHYNEKSFVKYQKKKINKNQLKIDYIYAPVFFALELVEIFNTLGDKYSDANYLNIANQIYDKTWLSSSDANGTSAAPYSLDRLSELDLDLLPYQKEFIENYPKLKMGLNLKGYILGFEQGLGKTITAIALAECGKFDHVYIVCPNALTTNWALELRKYYRKYTENEALWKAEVIQCKGAKNTNALQGKFFIINNESLKLMEPFIKSGNNMLIVDESHNFRNINAKRTKDLVELQTKLKATDTILLSGTPIKAIPNEIAPALYLLDPLFDENVARLYVKAFNINNISASEMINKRFGKVIYRKDKSELSDLPEKNVEELYYTLSNSDKYLFKNLRNQIFGLFTEIYEKKMIENTELMKQMISMVKKYSSAPLDITTIYCKWLTTINTQKIMRLHDSERDMIVDFLPMYVYPNIHSTIVLNELKKLESKFVHMKNSALSSAMGQILPPARRDLFIDLFHANMDDLIDRIMNCDKKTVIFSQFKPVVEEIYRSLNAAGIKSVMITGDVISDRMDRISAFKEDDTVRVLVASSKIMGTGFTLTEASQMFFFGPPWRDADFNQCCDRIHRIGQTSDVNIYVVMLDSGSELNVSTRMNKIMNWSKEMFDSAITVTENDSTNPIEEFESTMDSFEALESYFDSGMEGLFLATSAERNIDQLDLKPLRNILFAITDSIDFCRSTKCLAKYNDVIYINIDNILLNKNVGEMIDSLKKYIPNYETQANLYKKSMMPDKRDGEVSKSMWEYEGNVLQALYMMADRRANSTIFVIYGLSLLYQYYNELIGEPMIIEDYSYILDRLTAIKKLQNPFYRKGNLYSKIKSVILQTKPLSVRKLRTNLKRCENTKGELYYISPNSELKSLVPRIPKSVTTNEDIAVPRVYVSASLSMCLNAIPRNYYSSNSLLYIYSPLKSDIRAVLPVNKMVTDVNTTDECWILDEVNVKCVGAIIIGEIPNNLRDTGIPVYITRDMNVINDLATHSEKIVEYISNNPDRLIQMEVF